MMMMEVQLPVKITAEILSRLPVDSIIEFNLKLVCKTWRTLINNDIRFLLANYTGTTALNCQSSNSAAAAAEPEPTFGFFTLLENQQQLRYQESYKVEEEEEEEEEELEAHFKLTKSLKYYYPPLPRRHRHPFYEVNLITSLEILGSSNGLICLSACNRFTYNIYVYNPTTREFVEVRTETHMDGGGDGCMASGFGYHPSTNKYKVVRINYKTYSSSPSGHVSVYTLGSGWRDIGEIPYVISDVRKPPGVLVNGALYWITQDKKILSFELADEEFRIVSIPWEIDEFNRSRLGVLRGCLSLATSAGDDHRCTDTDVWIMNNNNKLYMSKSNRTTDDDDDDEPSWTRLPCIEFNKPLTSYNIDHSNFNEISSYGLSRELHLNLEQLVPYTKSFVSLKALGEENVKKIANKLARQVLSQGRKAGRQACTYLI